MDTITPMDIFFNFWLLICFIVAFTAVIVLVREIFMGNGGQDD